MHGTQTSKIPPLDLAQKSEEITVLLRVRLGHEILESGLKSLRIDSLIGSALTLSAANKFLASRINQIFIDDVEACAQQAFSDVEKLTVTVVERSYQRHTSLPTNVVPLIPAHVVPPAASAPSPLPDAATLRTSAGMVEGSPINRRHTFERFVVANGNRMAHAAAVQMAETLCEDQQDYSPLYVYGETGHGKTHLLHAMVLTLREQQPDARVLYFTAERFRYEFADACKTNRVQDFDASIRSLDILLVDDLEYVRGEKSELAFSNILHHLLDAGKRVVVASSRTPHQIDQLSERMRARLQSGLVVSVSTMDCAHRRAFLQHRHAEKQGANPSFVIPDDIVDVLAEKLSNGREIESAINRIYLGWQITRTVPDLQSIEIAIRDLIADVELSRVKIEDILRLVSRHFAVSRQDILSQRRHRTVVRPRQVGMYLAKHLTQRSLPEIGRRFGDRDHTTVLHAIRKIDKEINEKPQFKDEVLYLKRQLQKA